MKLNILLVILILLLVIVAVAIGGGLLVLLSYGVGWLVAHILPLSAYESTFLSLIAISVLGFLVMRFLGTILAPPPQLSDLEEIEDDEFDEDEDDLELDIGHPSRGRLFTTKAGQKLDFTGVKPDDRCPCGSGRKFKNCHGRGLIR